MVDRHRIQPRVIKPRPICLECGARATNAFTDVGKVIAHSCEKHHSEVHTIVTKKLKENETLFIKELDNE